ncbi:LOW QUALITY PROTEIN: hypothetical protein Smp_133330 [Schistosoma mansoni]|uniref:hypothetical protein n=1 Tax=Schistosoma mansoni TaxID=6183 RepID=UPI00022C864A|nr:LOW QUALITY PROTEIN: hypothetical protein Smp_133330 [Schistosoma mansoni]|eukprot:XP_018646226.1 LOW QUALITY PROTEIN: hypothetical protein Smp_133330 [Schistosoma mansoni]
MLHLRIVSIAVILFLTATRQDDDIGYFWHLSDIHCDLKYVNKSCNLPYGNYSCDSSFKLALNAINSTRMLFAKTPDFVIWSGDNGPHDDSLTSDQLLNGIRLISKALKQSFPVDEVYILPVLGNHDVVPANNMEITPQSRSRFDWCHKLGNDKDLWGEWINHRQKKHSSSSRPSFSSFTSENSSDFPMSNFSQTCFFSHYLVYNTDSYNHQSNLILISLNGLIWYQGNILAGTNDPDPLGQFNWLRQTFQWARKRKDKVLLVSHFPPGASENSPQWYQFLHPQMNDQLVNILIENADLLMTGLFAHEHVDSFRLLVSKSNIPVASLFLMPSISPLMLHGLGDFNPRIRLYRFQRSTMTLLGYSQYYFNLQNQSFNDTNPLNHWQLEYDTMTTYHLPDLSSNSLHLLWNNFLKEDNGYWTNYWNYELGGRSHALKPNYLTVDGLCPLAKSQCRCDHLCAMRFLILSDLNKCLQLCKDIKYIQVNDDHGLQHPMFTPIHNNKSSISLNDSIMNESSNVNSNERSSLPYIIGVIVAFLVVLVGIVLIVNREVCHRHRVVYHQHTSSLLANVIGNNHCTGGSCIELRTAFHPSYDDFYPEYFNKSVTSLNAIAFYINPTGRMVYVVNQLFDRCGQTSSRISHIQNNDTITTTNNNANTTHTNLSHCNDPQQYLFNKTSSTDEKSYTTSERSSNCHHHHQHHQKEDLQNNNSCLPEDYYADDEAFGDEDCSDLHHNNTSVHSGKKDLSISSQIGYHQFTTDKRLKLNQMKKQLNSHRTHHRHHHNNDPCRSGATDDDRDSMNDHMFHYDQESQLLNHCHINNTKENHNVGNHRKKHHTTNHLSIANLNTTTPFVDNRIKKSQSDLDQHLLMSFSLPTQTHQIASSKLNNNHVQHCDSIKTNPNSYHSYHPSTTRNRSIIKMPKCDYVRMSS